MRSSDSIYSSYLCIAQYTCTRFNIARDNQRSIYCVTTALTDYLLHWYDSFLDCRINCERFIYRRTWTCCRVLSVVNICAIVSASSVMAECLLLFIFLSLGVQICTCRSAFTLAVFCVVSVRRYQRIAESALGHASQGSLLLIAARSILHWQVQGLCARDTSTVKTETH